MLAHHYFLPTFWDSRAPPPHLCSRVLLDSSWTWLTGFCSFSIPSCCTRFLVSAWEHLRASPWFSSSSTSLKQSEDKLQTKPLFLADLQTPRTCTMHLPVLHSLHWWLKCLLGVMHVGQQDAKPSAKHPHVLCMNSPLILPVTCFSAWMTFSVLSLKVGWVWPGRDSKRPTGIWMSKEVRVRDTWKE